MAEAERWPSAAARRRLAVLTAVALAPVVPLFALTDAHLAGQPAALVVSTAAAALAVPVIAFQPLLAAGGRISWHRVTGSLALALVLVHVGALFIVSVEDTLFAMSPDGPTRGRMALLALIALLAVVALGATRRRLPISAASWRILHGFLAALVIALGLGHAVLTDGALDGPGTAALIAAGAVGLAGVAVAYAARTRRARRP